MMSQEQQTGNFHTLHYKPRKDWNPMATETEEIPQLLSFKKANTTFQMERSERSSDDCETKPDNTNGKAMTPFKKTAIKQIVVSEKFLIKDGAFR